MRSVFSTRRLQRLFDTGNYICTHRRYGYDKDAFHLSVEGLPIGRLFLRVKLIRKIPKEGKGKRVFNKQP